MTFVTKKIRSLKQVNLSRVKLPTLDFLIDNQFEENKFKNLFEDDKIKSDEYRQRKLNFDDDPYNYGK